MSTHNIPSGWRISKRYPCYASLPGAIINPHWLKLPLSRTNFHGPRGVRAIEVLLYLLCLRMLSTFHWNAIRCSMKFQSVNMPTVAVLSTDKTLSDIQIFFLFLWTFLLFTRLQLLRVPSDTKILTRAQMLVSLAYKTRFHLIYRFPAWSLKETLFSL